MNNIEEMKKEIDALFEEVRLMHEFGFSAEGKIRRFVNKYIRRLRDPQIIKYFKKLRYEASVVPHVHPYLDVIRKFVVISEARLAYEVGNKGRNGDFYAVLRYLIDAKAIRRIVDAKVVRAKGERWMKDMLVSPSFKKPPFLYEYVGK